MEHPSNACFIPLSRGFKALIDQADLPLVDERSWWVNVGPKGKVYAATKIAGRLTYMHRLLMAAGRGQQVDHENGNGIDNRRANLRICSRFDNARNATFRIGVAGYRGVAPSFSRWSAKISVEGRKLYIGSFDTPIEAALAYDAAARKHHGTFAVLNFPAANENAPAANRQVSVTIDTLRGTEFAA